MKFELTILGSNSAIPAHGRHPTAQVLNIREQLYLIDCGEGTQIQLQRYKIKGSKINHIFISHLHGDHFFGLIGLITTYHLLHRNKPLHIYGPPPLEDIIAIHLKHTGMAGLHYELVFHPIDNTGSEVILENKGLKVRTIPLKHRIPCSGFVFREKTKERHILPEMLERYNIPVEQILEIKKGADFTTAGGQTIANATLTTPPDEPRVFAYCTDTLYDESIVSYVREVDMLYHEATFDKSMVERARITHHATTEQAARIAQKARVKQLIIGHFSAKYARLLPLLEEARAIFENTSLAMEGARFEIPRKQPQDSAAA